MALDGLFLLFLLSYFADNIMTESKAVGELCYGEEFVDTDVRFQKSLLFIMQISQKPLVQTIGKFKIMCLNTFVLVSTTGAALGILLTVIISTVLGMSIYLLILYSFKKYKQWTLSNTNFF